MQRNVIYTGDCLEIIRMMPNECIDLTVTSPPYDKLRNYKGFKFHFNHIARHLFRITTFGGVLVWVVADQTLNGTETGTSFKQALFFKECGFRLHDTMIYAKTNFIPLTHNRYEQGFEYMFVFSKGRPKTFNPILEETLTNGQSYNLKRKGYCATIKEGAQRRRDEVVTVNEFKIRSNIFYYTCGSARVGHPAPFSQELVHDQIISWSNKGDLILDPFMGSGTTALVAAKLHRDFIGCELNPEYVKLSEKRLAKELGMFNPYEKISNNK